MKKVALAAARAGLGALCTMIWLGLAVAAMIAATFVVATVFGCPFGPFEIVLWWVLVLVSWAACGLGIIHTETWMGRVWR